MPTPKPTFSVWFDEDDACGCALSDAGREVEVDDALAGVGMELDDDNGLGVDDAAVLDFVDELLELVVVVEPEVVEVEELVVDVTTAVVVFGVELLTLVVVVEAEVVEVEELVVVDVTPMVVRTVGVPWNRSVLVPLSQSQPPPSMQQ